MDPRWIVIVLANALLVFLSGQINHYLGHFPVSLFLFGLAFPVAGLRLRVRPGLIAMFLSGLVIDAARPVPFGSSALILGLMFVSWHTVRSRLPREGVLPPVIGALVANAILFAAQPFLLGATLASGATWGRVVVDLLLSECAVVVIGPWFFALQEYALLLRGVNLADEARQPGGSL